MDKLDLLGVRYDCELEMKAKYELAKEISSFWKVNCTDDEFFERCLRNIRIELGENATYDEVYEIWEIIEKNFLDDDCVEIGDFKDYKHNCIIKWRDDYQQEHHPFNDYTVSTYYSVISNQHIGYKIANEICKNIKGDIIRDDGEYDIGKICEMIDEDCLNDIRIEIQGHVEEYLNNHLEL